VRVVFVPAAVAALVAGLACERPPAPRLDPPVGEEAAAEIPSPAALANIVEEAHPLELQAARSDCPDGMILVEGKYCPKVRHRCLDYLDPPGRYEAFRCARYAQPAECLAERVNLRFCIDRDEYVEQGEALPANFQSWTRARKTCEAAGKRVCRESEWNFACEGEQMRPYPYGWERDATVCNADHQDIVDAKGELRDRRARADEYPRCVSPFGVRNMAGNLEEFVTRDDVAPPAPAMKGAYWQPGRNHCRAAQTAHDGYYNGMETGFRCCSDAE
jgi:sulfatase modifying factor 1